MPDALLQPPHLLTVAEYLALGEPPWGYTELVEGRIVTTPLQDRRAAHAALTAAFQLHRQLPDGVEVIPALDVDLQLASPDGPGFVRRPDLVLVGPTDTTVTAADVTVAVEVVTEGSMRTDRIVKRSEYADAGIPHYWIIDVRERPSLIACHRAEGLGSAEWGGEFGYVDGGVVHGVLTTEVPFPLRLDLDALT